MSSKTLREINDLSFDPNNANLGTDRGREMLADSLERYGAGRSILADRNGVTIAGNKTLEQARRLGMPIRVVQTNGSELVVVQREDLDLERDKHAREIGVADNRIAEEDLQWSAEILQQLDIDLDRFFSAEELAELVGDVEQPAGDGGDEFDATPAPGPATSKPGDLYALGKHRLLCGDSTNSDDVMRLMNGERAVLFATDPPYLVDYDGTNHPNKAGDRDSKNKDHSATYRDWDRADANDGLYEGFISVAIEHAITPDAAWYCWHASRRQAMLEAVWERLGAFVHQQIIWAKDRPVLTRSHYMWAHEPCFFGWIRGSRPPRRSKDYPTTVWSLPAITQGDATDHPTPKPIECFAIPMRQHTRRGEICYEPFGGSGTQIIAAERLGRRCYTIEREPVYVDVILRRFEAETGTRPELLDRP